MPFIDDAPAAGLPLLSPAPLDITPPPPPFSRLFDTALRRDNIVGSITEAATQPPTGAFDPSFDPWAKIEGYEDHARSFIGANNDEDVLHVKARIDKERRDEEALSTGGWRGALAQLAAGALDPTMLMPVGGEVRAITRGGRALEGLIRGGAAFGAGSALQETGLQASQITRPMSESLMNVGGATVLGGILGGAVGGLTRPTMQMLRDLGDSSAAAGAVFDRELAANLPGRRPIDVPADVIDQPTVERAIAETFAAGGDTARVYDGIGARIRSELATGAMVAHVDQGGERVPIVAIDRAGMLTDANQARFRIDEVTAPGHSIEIQPRPADMGPLVDDPLALLRRGVFTSERAAEIAGLPPEDVLRLRASGIPFDQEMWKVIADNLTKAEASREGGVGVVADQLGYLQAGGASEREAVAVIGRSMQFEAARGGDAAQLLEDAVRERWGDAPPAWVAGRKQQLLEAAVPPGPLEGGIAGAEYRKLIAQGVPEEEARAEAALTQKRAEARAARHGGLGTAEELYRRENPDVVFGEAGELREGELGQAPSETKGHPQGEVEDTAWRRLEPEVTSEGKYRGAPDWVTNRFKLFQMRRLIQKLIAEGTPGRFWYEDSARRIMQITHGNLAEAEKLMGLVAIYSPQTRVFGNMVFAIKAYDQWKAGLPISVKTGIQDAKAQAWLEHGTDWGLSESGDVSVRNSRKTNNFYLNLMHELVTEHPDAIAGLNIPSDVLTAIKGATVDLWVLRALGYRIDAAGGVGRGATTKYGFSEREIQRATGWLNKDLPEGARRWLPHQVQAALWSAIKARYELPEVKAATMAESLRRGFSRMLPDENGVLRQVHPTAAGPERQGHMEVWRKHALRALPADVARAVETAKGSFGDAIDRIAQNVTGEAVPTSALGHEINNASPAAKEQFTRDALALIIDDDGNDVLAAHLGVNLNYNHIGTGTYKGGINPVVTTRLVPTKPAGFFDATLARAYARAWQYIFKQDAVPFFRADVAAKFKGDFSVRNTETDAVRRFDTQEAAQAYADRLTAEGKTAMLTGGPFSRGFHLEFAQDIDEALQQRLLSALQEEVGPSAGFTKTGDREITVVNYRQGEQRLPPVDDERFGDAIERIAALDDIKADVSRFGSEGEYGPVHDWQAEPGGPDQGIAGGSPAFQSWVRDRAEAFDRLLDDWHDPESRIAAGEPRPGAEPGLGEPRAAGEPGAPRGPPGEPDTGGVRPGGGGRGGAASAAEAQRGAAQAAAGQPSLTGLPNKPVQIGNVWYVAGPLARAKDAALNYMRRAGLIYDPPKTYVTVDPERAARIAAAFEAMEHNPDDPRVRAAYEALAKETLAQWEAIKETGLKVEWIKPGQEDPYAVSPRLALMDIIDNNHWWGFPTDLGYGTADATARHNNPMLQLTGEVIDGREVVVNDIFRIVHDYFGHAKEGVGFRASGEENAWRAHAAMYSDEARGAMTTETRGQNSWVNYGPHAETNRTASAADTIYSPQKIGLLPDWVENEGRADALEQAGRGKIRLGTEQQRALITLYRNAADASTLLHENWHQWVNELFRDAATPDAPPQLVADAATLRRAVGAKEGEPLTREQQEQLAKWGEQYTREGKAPSPELEGVFARFKEWLTDIYQTIKDLGVPINDDVRGAFDRMLTVPEGERIAGEAPTAGAGGSVGAAKVLDTSLDQETIASALGVEKALVRSSPTLRAGTSPLIDTRRIAHELADQPLDLKKNVAGIPTAQSVESLIKQFKGPLAEAEVGVDDAFVRYRLGRARRPFDIARLEARDMFGRAQGAMSYGEFRQAISRAMRRGDQSTDPEVAAAAKLLREKVFDPLKERAIAAGLLPEDVDTKTALSYLMRVYNANKIVAQRGQFADVITRWLSSEQAKKDTIRTRVTSLLGEHEVLSRLAQPRVTRLAEIRDELEGLVKSWEGETSRAAKAALAQRAEQEATRTPEQGRLRSADKPVIAAAKAIANANTRLEEIELRDIARQIIDRILGSPVGRLPYDMEVPHPRGGPPPADRAAPRGPLAGRAFMIPDELIEPWLENDSRQIARAYNRTMAPDVLLAERFGRTDMEAQFQQIQAGYERLRVGKSEAEQKKLHAAMQADLRDLGAMRDRLRGTYALPENPNGLGNRIYHVIRDLNYLRLLGGMTVSAFPDMGRTVMVHGFNRVFGDALMPMLKNFHQFKMAAKEAKLAGTALDMVLDTRAMSMADMLDDYGRWTNYERGLKGLTDKFGLVTLMAPWNAAMKQIAGVIGQTRTLEVIEDLVAGRAVRPAERTRLASLGIGPDMAERIDAMFKAHGAKQENGTWWANTEAWTDQRATEAFRSALNKEIDTTIVTQGQEVPLWMSRGVGRLIGQFRSFSVASAQRVMMTGLQKRDMATLNGAVMMIGLGMLVYTLRTLANPKAQPLPDPSTPGGAARWLREGVDISGLTGWLFDAHNMIEKATGGGIGLSRLTGGPGQSRYMNYNTLDALLGPTAGLVEDAARLTGEAAKGTWSAGDSSRVRRMIPFQNLIGFRHLFDAAEHGLNHSLGVREPAPPR